MFVEAFCKAGISDFFQLLNSDCELYLCDEVASAFHMIPNNMSFIKYIKLISAIPMTWIITTNSNSHELSYAFSGFKKNFKSTDCCCGQLQQDRIEIFKRQIESTTFSSSCELFVIGTVRVNILIVW